MRMRRNLILSAVAICSLAVLTLKLFATAELEVLSVGVETGEYTPIRIRLSPGRFDQCYVRCGLNGEEVDRTRSKTEFEHVVKVLTGTKGGNPDAQYVERSSVVYIIGSGEKLPLRRRGTEVKLFECVDNLQQRWVHYAGVL